MQIILKNTYNMKKLIIVLAIALSSCSTASTDANEETSHRIIGKEYTVYHGAGYQIIEVDGKEFIASTNGGLCPLLIDTVK